MGKKWDKTACGSCKKLFTAENLTPDFKNNRYLCDNCYEPRENINEEEKFLLIDEENPDDDVKL